MSIRRSRPKNRTEFERALVAYAFISPFYILFAIFGLFPIGMAIVLGFFRWRGNAESFKFLALANYIDILTPGKTLFYKSLGTTLVIGIPSMVINVFGALVLAFILYSKIVKGSDLFRTIYFMPMVTSAVAAAMVFRSLFNFRSGIVNQIAGFLGFQRVDWIMGNGAYFKFVVIAMSGWQWLGWNLVIFFAGMQGISQDINEAAIIDGASHTRIFFNITLPILKPIVLFTLVQATIGTFQLFTEPFMLRNGSAANGGPGYSGLTLMVYILQQAPQNLNFGYAAAMANVLCVMIIIVSLFITGIMGEKDEPKYRKRAEAV